MNHPTTDKKVNRILNELSLNNNQRFAAMTDFARKLEHSLRKAMLWTDRENDIGEWRDEAEEMLGIK